MVVCASSINFTTSWTIVERYSSKIASKNSRLPKSRLGTKKDQKPEIIIIDSRDSKIIVGTLVSIYKSAGQPTAADWTNMSYEFS